MDKKIQREIQKGYVKMREEIGYSPLCGHGKAGLIGAWERSCKGSDMKMVMKLIFKLQATNSELARIANQAISKLESHNEKYKSPFYGARKEDIKYLFESLNKAKGE